MLLLLASGISAFVAGQSGKISGVVTYESTRKLQIKLEGHDLPADMPKEMKSVKELLFTMEEAIFRGTNSNLEEEALQEATGGSNIMLRMREPEVVIYSDLRTRINTEQREFMTRLFHIETYTDTAKWRLTGNRKKILKYECLEAELTGSFPPAVAWFTPDIAISCGPAGFCGLPGLILALDIDNGKASFNATSVEFKDPGKIEKPDQGKKVTRLEFDAIVKEKKKEQEELGNADGIIFRHAQ